MSSSSPIFYPNISRTPAVQRPESAGVGGKKSKSDEFSKIFDRELDLSNVSRPLKFSAHATQRLSERGINFDEKTLSNINEAINKAESKGVDNSLVLTDDAALIVSVKNRTVVTAMDRGSLANNVFTNIDGAIIV